MRRRRTDLWAIGAIVTALLALTGRVTAGEMNSLSKEEIAEGWILLFDGATTFGWDTYGGAKWQLVDGTLVSDEGEGWILRPTKMGQAPIIRDRSQSHFRRSSPTSR